MHYNAFITNVIWLNCLAISGASAGSIGPARMSQVSSSSGIFG